MDRDTEFWASPLHLELCDQELELAFTMLRQAETSPNRNAIISSTRIAMQIYHSISDRLPKIGIAPKELCGLLTKLEALRSALPSERGRH